MRSYNMPEFCQICAEEVSMGETKCSYGHEVAGDFNYTLVTPADMVREYAEVSQQKGTPELYHSLIAEEYEEFVVEVISSILGNSPAEDELKEMADLTYVLYGYARVKGYNLDKALERIHQNNMGRMYQPDGTILRRYDGKVLKNKDYPKVELGDLV
jgi:predicted HAD superfamily Cof-like phosphohydrolase